MKEMHIEGLREALRRDAQDSIAKGTMKLPVDVEEFAVRLQTVPTGLGLIHADYVQAIKDVCTEMSLEMKGGQ